MSELSQKIISLSCYYDLIAVNPLNYVCFLFTIHTNTSICVTVLEEGYNKPKYCQSVVQTFGEGKI